METGRHNFCPPVIYWSGHLVVFLSLISFTLSNICLYFLNFFICLFSLFLPYLFLWISSSFFFPSIFYHPSIISSFQPALHFYTFLLAFFSSFLLSFPLFCLFSFSFFYLSIMHSLLLSFPPSLLNFLPAFFCPSLTSGTITANISVLINLLSASPPDCGWVLCIRGYPREAPRRPASLLHTLSETCWSIWARTEPRSWPSGSSASEGTTCQKPGEATCRSSARAWNPDHGRLYPSTTPFSFSISRIYLIGSTPGRFQGPSMEKWGHLKLRKVCENWDQDELIWGWEFWQGSYCFVNKTLIWDLFFY